MPNPEEDPMTAQITLVGNIATPPQFKTLPSGLTIATFRLASSQRRFDQSSGGWVDGDRSFFTVSAYRRLAEHVHRSLNKGDRVVLTGRVKVREWENDSGKGTAVEIDAEAIGPDLMWGTTVFQRDGASQGATPASSDTWAVPGGGDAVGGGSDAASRGSVASGEWPTVEPGAALTNDARELEGTPF